MYLFQLLPGVKSGEINLADSQDGHSSSGKKVDDDDDDFDLFGSDDEVLLNNVTKL